MLLDMRTVGAVKVAHRKTKTLKLTHRAAAGGPDLFYNVLLHVNIAADSSRWTKGCVYVTIVNSITAAAAMEMIATWLQGESEALYVLLFLETFNTPRWKQWLHRVA